MISFQQQIPISRLSRQPVYLQITAGIIQLIRSGGLRRGRKLPGSRKLGLLLGVNRMTVVAAYNELAAQGWVDQQPKKGCFVRGELPELMPQPIATGSPATTFSKDIPFLINPELTVFPYIVTAPKKQLVIDDGFPDPRLTPIETLSRAMRGISRVPGYKQHLRYGDTQGSPVLREALGIHLNDTRGLPVTPANILITRGATMGIYLSARVITCPGDHVIMSEPGFGFVRELMIQLGLRIHTVPVDEQGMDTNAVEAICRKNDIRFIYVVPHHHYPTTVTLPPERRIRLLELAHQYQFAIIEDDYDYDFHYASMPILPMASIDQYGAVIYIGTLTKTLAPSIRIGFLTATEKFVERLTAYRKMVDFQGDTFMELAIASLFQDRTIEKHIRQSLKTYRGRRDHFCGLLKNTFGSAIAFDPPAGGMAVWTRFNNISLPLLQQKAAKKGLLINKGNYFTAGKLLDNTTRLGFASLNPEEQEKVVSIIRSCL